MTFVPDWAEWIGINEDGSAWAFDTRPKWIEIPGVGFWWKAMARDRSCRVQREYLDLWSINAIQFPGSGNGKLWRINGPIETRVPVDSLSYVTGLLIAACVGVLVWIGVT